MGRHLRLLFVVSLSLGMLNGCGGGGGSEKGGDSSDPCTTLKIAGGQSCSSPPPAIAMVKLPSAYCSGTFITKRHVLTAAHCFEFGGASSTRIETPNFSYQAAAVSVHPSFNPSSISDTYDIAVVTIGSDAPVNPVPINTSRAVQVDDSVVTYGYGLDQNDQTAFARIVNGEAPVKATALNIIGVSPSSINSISNGTGDTCAGDSGGSLLLDGNNGSPGIVAVVRAGPSNCEIETGPSDNTNLQNPQILNFVRGVAPGAQLN